MMKGTESLTEGRPEPPLCSVWTTGEGYVPNPEYVAWLEKELALLRESEAEWQRRGDRAVRAERSLRLILGLLSERRWWNDNVNGAEQIAKEALLDVR